MKKSEKNIDVIFLIDKSGSMNGTESDTIGGYNNYLKQNQNNYTKISTIFFDHEYKIINFRKEANSVKELTEKDYIPSGCTALYDAIGKTINKLDKEHIENKVLFIITTDGYENSSTDYGKKDIVKLIKTHKNYEFIYLGANIDSYAESEKLGISRKNTANYSKQKIGKIFERASLLSKCMIENIDFDEDWKNDLE